MISSLVMLIGSGHGSRLNQSFKANTIPAFPGIHPSFVFPLGMHKENGSNCKLQTSGPQPPVSTGVTGAARRNPIVYFQVWHTPQKFERPEAGAMLQQGTRQ